MNNDEELIKACIRGDQRACKQLYDRFAPQMYALCLRYSHSNLVAQDILHDGFIKVFDNLSKLRSASSLAAWIRSVIVKTAIDNWHKEKQTANIDTLPENMEFSSNSFSEICAHIDIQVILNEVRSLPPAYRMAFNLCDVEGYQFAEAADILGITESTVRSNLTRARSILATKLGKIYKKKQTL